MVNTLDEVSNIVRIDFPKKKEGEGGKFKNQRGKLGS